MPIKGFNVVLRVAWIYPGRSLVQSLGITRQEMYMEHGLNNTLIEEVSLAAVSDGIGDC